MRDENPTARRDRTRLVAVWAAVAAAALGLYVATRPEGAPSPSGTPDPPASQPRPLPPPSVLAVEAEAPASQPRPPSPPPALADAEPLRAARPVQGVVAGGDGFVPGSSVPEEVRARAAGEVVFAVQSRRPALVAECWDPFDTPGSQPIRVAVNISFDAAGLEVGRNLEDPGTERPEVAQCLRRSLEPLRISPPGFAVDVAAELTFP